MMEDFCLRFSHLVMAILAQIDDKSLNKFRKVSRICCISVDNQRFKWIRIIKKYIGHMEKSWENAVHKAPFGTVKKLALAVQFFYKIRKSRHQHQWTPLHIAAERGHLSLCKYIVKKTEDKFPKRLDGPTPLHLAAQNNHWNICKYLIGRTGYFIVK